MDATNGPQEQDQDEVEADPPAHKEPAGKSAAAKVLEALNLASANDADVLDALNQDDEEEETLRTPSQIAGRRKNSKKTTRAAAPSVPAKVKKMMGDGLTFRFYKIDKFGKSAVIGDYSSEELANANDDIELFIQSYLVAEYEAGSYRVIARGAKGNEVMDKTYAVLAPKGQRPALIAAGAGLFEQTQLSSQTKQLNELQEKIRQSEKDEREALRIANEKQAEQIASMKGGGETNMMSMFMMMQQTSEAANRRAEAADRRAKLELEKIRLEANLAAAAAPPPPLPPPPPLAPDPIAMLGALMGVVKQMMPAAPAQNLEALYLRDRIKDLESRGGGPTSMEDIFHQANQMDELFKSRYGDGGGNAAVDMVKGFMDNFAENMDSVKSLISEAGGKNRKQVTAKATEEKQPGSDDEILPDGFIELIMELDDAGEEDEPDLARINCILRVLQMFSNSDTKKYQLIANQLIVQISENKKKPVMYMLKQILEECTKREMITAHSSVAAYKAVDRHFDQVHSAVTGKPGPGQIKENATEEEAPAPAPEQPQPAEEASTEIQSATPAELDNAYPSPGNVEPQPDKAYPTETA